MELGNPIPVRLFTEDELAHMHFKRLIHVRCNGCGLEALTGNFSDPDGAVQCGCCPIDHSHAGDVCDRTVTITASASLTGNIG